MISTPSKRIIAIDALRGFTIGFMILVNNPGSWTHVYSPLRHAKWHGCTPTDLVFPFFLFIMGISMRFSFKKYNYIISRSLLSKIFWRFFIIFFIGILLNTFPFILQNWDWSSIRIMGVLQRIAISYLMASLFVLLFKEKNLIYLSSFILLFYWFALLLFGGKNPYSLETNLVRILDIAILGEDHLYMGTGIPFDPEGLFSSLPASVTVIIGFLIGSIIQIEDNKKDVLSKLIILGILGILSGLAWGLIFPINKHIWTSSYVLYSSGIAILFFALFNCIINIMNLHKLVWPLVVFGTNSIFVYSASILWSKVLLFTTFDYKGTTTSGYNYLYETVFIPLGGNMNGSLIFALSHVLGFWLLLFYMQKKKLHIKI